MFCMGDRVMYGIHGVCRIIGTEIQMQGKNRITYLILEPLEQAGSRYLVPTDSKVAMEKLKRMLSRVELDALMQSESVRQDCWIPDEGQRKQIYRERITAGDREQLISIIYTLYRHKVEQTAAGRKMHMCDENFLKDAERVLVSEIAAVMEMETDTARAYLRRVLSE